MKKTENYNLNLPEKDDNYSVEDSNNNMNIIDAMLKEHTTEMNETQAEIDEVQAKMTEAQAEIDVVQVEVASVQTKADKNTAKVTSIEADVTKLKSDVKTLSDKGVNIAFDEILLSNSDTNLMLCGYIRGDIASIGVSGWIGSNTVKNSTHLRKIIDNNAEYEKMFEQFDILVTVPYSTASLGYRRATISVTVGKGVITELVFTNKTTGEKKYTYEINDYINNSAYEWTGTIDHNGIEIWLQNMPDVNSATYPLCINASLSCAWEGK